MKKKMLLSMLAILLLSLIVLTACGRGNGDDNNDTPDAPETGQQDSQTPAGNGQDAAEVPAVTSEFAERLTISMSIMDAHDVGRHITGSGEWSPTMLYLMERFNVEFELVPLEWGTFLETTQLWLSAGIAPDVLFMDVHPSRYGEFYLNATRDGFFRPYNLDANPNLRAAFEAAPPAAHAFMINNNLYAWPGIVDFHAFITPRRIGGFSYRRDWAEAVGLAQPDSLYTYEQWIELVMAVVEQNPGDVPGGVIGAVAEDWVFPNYSPIGGMSPGLLQYVRDGGQYVWGPTLPQSLELIHEANRLYQLGVIWEDQVLGGVQPNIWFQGNIAFSVIEGGYTFNRLVEVVREYIEAQGLEPSYELMTYHATNTIAFGMVEMPQGGFLARYEGGIWSQTGMSSTISEENAVRWEAIMDFLVSDEGYLLRNFGMRGIDWDLDANGDFVLMWDIGDDGAFVDPLGYFNMWAFNRVAGNSDAPFLIFAPETQIAVILQAWNRLVDTITGPRAVPVPFDLDMAYFTGPTFMSLGALSGDLSDMIDILSVANPNDIDSMWQDFLNTRLPLIQPVVDEINEMLN